MVKRSEHTAVLDIGKTHVKLNIIDHQNQIVFSRQMSNNVDYSQAYPCVDEDRIWRWFCETMQDASSTFSITRLTTTTHGATAALVNRNRILEDGLVMPILDYETKGIFEQSKFYDEIRPKYDDTFSPNLPAGLNLGRQLYWLNDNYPEKFKEVTDILMYPQYWVWRLTGKCYGEKTSLGCHTDLWSVKNNNYSDLIENMGWQSLFPPVKPAWHECGPILPYIAQELGLTEACEVYNGIHDSNASFLRYILIEDKKPFTVISSGTWTILMASQVALNTLQQEKDMLANIDALGQPVACARFMGGREFELICKQAGSWLGEQFDEKDVQGVIDNSVFALPDFSDGSGPFGGKKSEFIGVVDRVSGIALATIYCALMIDYQLELLKAEGTIYIEGAFLKNPMLCALLQQLRPNQTIALSADNTGTVLGAAYLTRWHKVTGSIEVNQPALINVTGLDNYKQKWLQYLSKL